jgi:hypothetical protein
MVTVKTEVPVESAVLEDTQQWDFDHFGGPADAPEHLPLMKQQQFWSHPGPAGPQEKYVANFSQQESCLWKYRNLCIPSLVLAVE